MTSPNKAFCAWAGFVFFFGCGDHNMGWERRPIFDEEYMQTFALAMVDSGRGFLGASIGSKAGIREPNFKKALAMDTAIIQETKDAWNTRTEAFRSNGEINSLVSVDSGYLIALNTRIEMETLAESAHFIQWSGETWKEISSLPVRAIRVWADAGPFLYAAGYPDKGFEPVLMYASFDGASSWQSVSLAGMNPLDTAHDEQVWLDRDGLLYAINSGRLEAFDLPHWKDQPAWKTLHALPEGFKPIRITGNSGGILSIGRLADSSLVIWRVPKAGSPELVRTKGLPATLNPDRIWARDTLLRVTGTVESLKNGETTGYRNWLLESKDNGATWKDLDLPLKGSLGSIAFGEDGRIWAMAAGNRMQVYRP